MSLTTLGVLTLLTELQEAREKRRALNQRGKVDLALTAVINDLDYRVTTLPADELRELVNRARLQTYEEAHS